MRVTRLEQLNNKRYTVHLDSGESFVLYRGELNSLKIREDDILPDATYEHIMTEVLPKRAKLRGLNLLKARPYTEYMLRKKYSEGGYPDTVTDIAIEYLKGLHLIDDAEYCRVFMTYNSAGKSRKRMMMDLTNKGVAKDIISEAMAELDEAGDMTSEDELILKLLNKRHYDSADSDYESRQKIRQYLYGKGFNMDAINRLT